MITKGMNKPLICCAAFAICLLVPIHAGLAFTNAPAIGESLPPFELPIPQDTKAQSYLGLSGTGQFTIAQIEAKVVIIQIFSMYCPVCQKEAFRVNELYRTIQKRKDLKDKIRMIGIGTGNTPFEVGFFQKNMRCPFLSFLMRTCPSTGFWASLELLILSASKSTGMAVTKFSIPD